MKRYLLPPLLLACLYAYSQKTDSLIAHYGLRAEKYLAKDKSVYDYFDIGKPGIRMYASPAAKAKDSAEFFMKWEHLSYCKHSLTSGSTEDRLNYYKGGKSAISPIVTFYDIIHGPKDQPLLGKKIAIDPGHIGGDTASARMERRLAKIKSENGTEYVIREGNLTMQTALILKTKLEKLGAKVMLTRNGEGMNAFGYSFSEWMKKNFEKSVIAAFQEKEITAKERDKLLSSKTGSDYIFYHFFLQEELKQRAKLINGFQPDLSVIIHYNVDESNKNWTKPSTKNYNMVFIPGAFMKGEMETVRDRFEFLRLLISDDLSRSASLSSYLIKRFEKKLKVPAATENDAEYLLSSCKSTPVPGVYCRNLTLTRYVHGTLIYGEPLYLDNVNEYKLMSKPGNERIILAAEAFYDAVLEYFQK
ncbi:MAG: N-acetylmuramoyl-L-alanine amidase [Bacteroidota bacterium]